MKHLSAWALSLAAMLAVAGCGRKAEETPQAATGSVAALAAAGTGLETIIVTGPAPQAIGVTAAKEKVQDGETVAVEGRVKDFVDGAPVFTLTDGSLPSCKDNGEDCPTPWDFCCFDAKTIAANTATIRLVASDGQPLSGSPRGTNSLDHLTTVVAEGKARRDAQGNLVVEASKVYVMK